jgi:hypothetical protein
MASRPLTPVDRRVFDAPMHVAHGDDGMITIFLPDGHRLVMTADAAERSGAILWRTGLSQRTRRRGRPARRSGQVIAVDFAEQALQH